MANIENFNAKFLEFAKSKPSEEFYNAWDCRECALGQFVSTFGYQGGGSCFWDDNDNCSYYPEVAMQAAIPTDISQSMTWGGLVTRLESRMNETKWVHAPSDC